jgi:hypothetical protein
VRLYGLRAWIERGYRQVKDELGWAGFRVCSDRAGFGPSATSGLADPLRTAATLAAQLVSQASVR